MNTKSIIEIFRGDDSDALGYQTIVGTIHTDLDLTGCKAVFRYLGFFQEFDPIPEDGKLTIVIPSASSMQFPPGFGYASLKVYDIDRKVRTFTNRIPVFVKTMTPCRGGGEFDVEFSPFPELAPLKIFKGPNADDFDLYTGFISKIIDRASAQKYGLSMLFDAMDAEKTAEGGCAASPAAVKAAYDAVIGVLTDNYYTAAQTDEAIDKLAAYYITSDTQGNPFATHAALVNATTYYSGGSVRTPTRNDYAIVVADETHDNEEWRYIYSENEQGVGQWEPQYAVEGVITFDDNVTRTSANGVKSSGIWSAIWGALSALPTGFSSLYDWCVAQIAKLRDKLDLNVYGYGNPVASFADGFSVVDSQGGGAGQRYTAPSGGETITFIGPVPSSNPYLSNHKFYYPSTLGTLDAFDPDNYSVWCLVCPNGGTTPSYMMYRTGPYYYIGSFNSVTPTLALGMGEATGDAPTMARPLGATGDTLAKVSQIPAVVAPSTSASDSGKAADAKATGDALAGKASTADATLTPMYSQTPTFSSWQFSTTGGLPLLEPSIGYSSGTWTFYDSGEAGPTCEGDWDAVSLEFNLDDMYFVTATRTRTDIIGYILGPDDSSNPNIDKPLASEAEAEALRTGKQSALSAQQLANIAAVPGKLDKSGGTMTGSLTEKHGLVLGKEVNNDFDGFRVDANGNAEMTSHAGGSAMIGAVITAAQEMPNKADRAEPNHAGNLAALDSNGNPTNSQISAANVAQKGNIPYTLGTPTVIDTASSETVEGETVYYGAATLANRTANIVQVTAATALDELRITFPAATSGKVRDFGLRVEIGTGSAALTAPSLVPIAPTGETIKIENADGTIPALADGTATAKGVTLLYFSETAPGVFVVKGEQVEEVA